MPHVVASALGRISAAPGANVRRIWSEAFKTVRAETERRAAHLSPEDQIVQSMADASPAKWHRAHTTWFFETFLLRSEEHTSELQSLRHLVCRLLLEKKKKQNHSHKAWKITKSHGRERHGTAD